MAFENLCMYCFEENGGADVCPHCGRDARAAVPQIQLLPGTLVYNERFLIGRALGQDAGGIVYSALDTRRNVKIRIREYLPRDCARRLNSGEVVPEPGAEDQFEAGMRKLRASVEGVEDPSKRHFFFEENGTGYIAQRKSAGGAEIGGDDEGDRRGVKMALVVALAALLVIGVAAGVIALVNYFTNTTDVRTEAPAATGLDIWQAPVSPSPTPYAAATFAAITDPTHSWMEFTNPDLQGNESDYKKPTPAPTPKGGFDSDSINGNSDPELIRKLQQLLTDLGWLEDGNVNGKYDSATRQAVKDFQQYMNDTYAIDPKLAVDGVAGPKTITWLLKTDIAMKPVATPEPVTPAPTMKDQVIDENSTSAEIKYVQTLLMRLGVISAKDITGRYDAQTKAAVKAFQMRVNDLMGYDALKEDGVCDDRTLAYLEFYVQQWEQEQPTPRPNTPEPTQQLPAGDVIDENSNRTSIKAVQEMLITLGYLEGSADGVYGRKTYEAVSEFQEFLKENVNSAVQVTGKCDILTREYLERFSSEAQVTSQPTVDIPGESVETPDITVTGYQDYVSGVYIVGEAGVKIAWSADGAASYDVELVDQSGSVKARESETLYESMPVTAAMLSGTEVYHFRVTPVASDGSRGANAHVSLIAMTADATASPTEPASSVPTITVTGALSYTDGVYHIGADGAAATWKAAGAELYSVYITNSAGETVYKRQNTTVDAYELDAAAMIPGERYTLRVIAIPEGGSEDTGASAFVMLTLDAMETPEPTPTPASDFEAPVITVDGGLGEMDGVNYIGKDIATITWQAKGSVRAYSVYLTNSAGGQLTANPETDQTSMHVNPATMTDGEVYTLTVIAIPENGYEEHGKSAQVKLALYNGQTPTPTVGAIGQIAIQVSGHIAIDEEMFVNEVVYIVGDDGVQVTWDCEGAVSAYDVLITGAEDEVVLDKTGVDDIGTLIPAANLEEDVVYTISVTAIPGGGTAENGTTAAVKLMRPSNPGLGDVIITVKDQASEKDGVYAIGDKPLAISWKCEGAAAYSVYLTDDEGNILNSEEATSETKLTIGATGMTYGEVYTLTVTADSPSGDPADRRSASVKLTPAVDNTPDVGDIEIGVEDYLDYSDGIYWVDDSGVSVYWNAENAAKYNVVIFDPSGKEIRRADGTTQTRLSVETEDMVPGSPYSVRVTPIDSKGRAGGDGVALIAHVEVEATPEPGAGKPVITVSGHADEDSGVYIMNDTRLSIEWTAENAEAYDVFIYGEDGRVLNSAENAEMLGMTVKPESMPKSEIVTVTVTGIAANGERGESESVFIRLMPEEEPTPEPTAEPTAEPVYAGMPEINVRGHAEYADGIYYVGDETVTISWTAENAEAYSVFIYDADGSEIKAVENSDIDVMTVDPATMPEGRTVTVMVVGISGDGTEGESAGVRLRLAEPEATPEPTPEPTEEPASAGRPDIQITGHADYENGKFIAGSEVIGINWLAENAETYDVYITDAGGNELRRAENTTVTGMTIDPADITADGTVIITVTGISAEGNKGESASAAIVFTKAEPTPEPTEEPAPTAGTPSIDVSGHTGIENGVYIAGESDLNISWYAENAAAYDVAIYDGSNAIVNSAYDTGLTEFTLRSTDLNENENYVIAVAGLSADGERGEIASVVISRRATAAALPMGPVTQESDPASIGQLQAQLLALGWITMEDSGFMTAGVLDDITVQAIIEFQDYALLEGLSADIIPADPMDPMIDQATIDLLFSVMSPVVRPQ